jgi:hypothetical protein
MKAKMAKRVLSTAMALALAAGTVVAGSPWVQSEAAAEEPAVISQISQNGSQTASTEISMAIGYKLTYEAQLATGGKVPVDEKYYKAGEKATVLDNTGNLVGPKDTPIFDKWVDANGREVKAGSEYEILAPGPNRLRAEWRAAKDVNAKVVFAVKNGQWDDETTDSIRLSYKGKENELKLNEKDIPAVGTKPADGFEAGEWDVVPTKDTVINGDVTFTYTYKAKATPTPTPTPTPVPKKGVTVYRLYYGPTKEHFYTTGEAERKALIARGWDDEKVAWIAAEKDDENAKPVYRLCNAFTADHHFTDSTAERDALKKYGWIDEGVAFYANTKGDTTVYRLWKSGLKTGAHHFTTSKNEYDTLVKRGWVGESEAFKVNAES